MKRLAKSGAQRGAGRGLALAIGLAAGFVAAAIAACGGSKTPPGGGGDRGLVAWEEVRAVFQHPRCQNCHPSGDAPLQGDLGVPHQQNVQRGPEGKGAIGMECVTCHGPANLPSSYGDHVPPGIASGWRMPKPEEKLVFVGMSSGALCEQTRDPARNGHMDAAKLRHHIDDPLVQWGWDPGRGRQQIPVSREQFVASFEAWLGAGMPCPPAQ